MKPTLVFDTEVYTDYFLLAFMNADSKEVMTFEMYEGQTLDVVAVRKIIKQHRLVSFNGRHYDIPIITEALNGGDCARLKRVSDRIIVGNEKYWTIGIEPVECDHIDMIEVAPGVAGLKIYGGRLHCQKMQDLPIEPDALISEDDRKLLTTYCINDLQTTLDLFNHLAPQIELREHMSKTYGIDMRSKSDAQIAEAVIGAQVSSVLKRKVYRPDFDPKLTFKYEPPAFIQFTSEPLQHVLDVVRNATFTVNDKGSVEMPDALAGAKITVGNGLYRMGIGGLHSSETCVAHLAGSEFILVDRDVVSYYPRLIIVLELFPKHLGQVFTGVYKRIVERRIRAKVAGDKVTSDALKIVANSCFGKFGSMWSRLYSPNLLIQTTVTGQLSLLMLIETLEANGIPVVSANTDGIVIKCPIDRQDAMLEAVRCWEGVTGFETEETPYTAIYSRDVNNYIAVKPGGGVKLKGAFAIGGLQKNPTNEVCIDAVVAMLTKLTPVEKTIRECRDIRKFITIRQVKGGAVKDDVYLGKAVRWYYAGVEGCITYKSNGYTVARSEGAKPLMELPETLPDDIDYDWYVREANALLADLGADKVFADLEELV
jgi:hypothetical protein